jgi:hypothetical protein
MTTTHTTDTHPACTGAPDLCGAPAGQPCDPGCPSLATEQALEQAPAPTRFAVLVKGPRGRKWFRADSAQTGDGKLVQAMTADLAQTYPGLYFRAGSGDELDAPIAPARYRPWDPSGGEAEQEVALDELTDEQL